MPDPVRFRGTVSYERYYNEGSFWGVFIVNTTDDLPYREEVKQPNVFEDDEGFQPHYVVTVAGKVQHLYVGSEYEFVANPTYNSKFKSWQYEPISVTSMAPTSLEASKLFLGSILTERQASVLLKEYPNIIQEVIDNKDNINLSKLYGIGQKTWDGIREKIISNYVISDIISLLQPYGVTYSAIKSLLKWEPNSAILKQKIKDNPYDLTNARGFGFSKVDSIALKLQPELIDSSKRLFAFIKYTLGKAAEDNGHTWISFYELNNMISDQIPQCKELYDKLVGQKESPFFGSFFYIKDDKIGLRIFYDCEMAVYNILKELDSYQFRGKIDVQAGIEKAEKQLGYELSEDQKSIVGQIERSNVVLFTGPAGTGKSSSARAILNSFIDSSIACCSLSAKAAQRIQEATGFRAKTAHRMLGAGKDGFAYNSEERMPYDVVFIDEASMLNCSLFYHIVSAVKEGAKVIICGDHAQLPPIGAGNVFSDLLHMKNDFNISVLSKVHRQAEKSGILTDANKIRIGEFPITEARPQIVSGELGDMIYVFRDNRERMQDIAVKQFLKLVASKGLDNVISITPRRDTVPNSALEINKQIQRHLIDIENEPCVHSYTNDFYVGDRVIQVENNAEKDVFNGEVGFVEKVYPNSKEVVLTARFKSTLTDTDKLVDYSADELKTLMLGYCLSIHKSQGSEYDYVIVTIDNTHYALLDNCILYTAITRAKKACVLIAQPEAFSRAMKNNFNRSRQTWLRLKYEEGE